METISQDAFSMFEDLPTALLVIDSNGLIVYSNSQIEDIFGYSSKELLGKSLEMLVPEQFRNLHIKHKEQYKKDLKRRKMDAGVLYGLHKNGAELYIDLELSPHVIDNTPYFIAVIRDIFEHYRESIRLKDRDRRFTSLLNSTGSIAWAADIDTWDFVYVSPQAANILGYPIEQWYQKGFWLDKIHPDDRQRITKDRASCDKKEVFCELDYRMLAADGRVVWFHEIVDVEYKNVNSPTVNGFLIDITQLKLKDKKLEDEIYFSNQIIDALPGLFCVVDRQYKYVRVNTKTEQLLGLTEDELIGRVVTDFVAEDNREGLVQAIDKCFQQGQYTHEYMNIDKDGNQIPYAGYGVKTNIANQDYIIAMEFDISKQKIMETKLGKLSNDLAHVNRVTAVGELTASVAHELNQPLAAIMSNAQAAQKFLDRETPDIEEVKDALTDIINDDRRAGNVINNLRKLLIKSEPDKEVHNCIDLIREVIGFVRNDAQNKGITIVFQESDDLSVLIECDKIQIQQVALNLILNAFDALAKIDRKSRQLEIKINQDSKSDLTVQFIDNGIGFEGQNIDRLFDAFYTSKSHGLGMGLAISRSIIGMHNGSIYFEQNENGGATFCFSLPIYNEGEI